MKDNIPFHDGGGGHVVVRRTDKNKEFPYVLRVIHYEEPNNNSKLVPSFPTYSYRNMRIMKKEIKRFLSAIRQNDSHIFGRRILS